MGSLFNGTTGGGGLEGNHMKSLTTRSGHTIKLNDSLSSLGITIKDIKGNSIHIDSVGDDIIINAKRNITINAGETFYRELQECQHPCGGIHQYECGAGYYQCVWGKYVYTGR